MSKNKYSRPVCIRDSQNFLTSSAVIDRIINISGLSSRDHAIEIGAGKGHITKKLLGRCAEVTAYEIDRELYNTIETKFKDSAKLKLICGDFLQCELPGTPYKVFANIPFNRTTDIIKKLANAETALEEAWLVVEKGAAKRFAGLPRESTQSLMLKPFFDFEIKYYFRREDFHPAPSVDAVLLRMVKKRTPDIAAADRYLYNRFISACFSHPKGIYGLLTKRQIQVALKLDKLSCDISSKEMLYVQWLCLFRCWLKFK